MPSIYKRFVWYSCFVLAVVPQVIFGQETDPQPDGTKDRLVDAVVTELCEGKFEAVTARFTPPMREALSTEKLAASLKGVQLLTGEFNKKGPVRTLVEQPLTVEATAYHERQSLIYRISFDKDDKISGLFARPAPLPDDQKEASGSPLDRRGESEVSIARNDLEFFGTLRLPVQKQHAGPWPLVIFHSGSGPTDRNGNGPTIATDMFRKMAIGLADQGIASLRFDKRGTGKTTPGITEAGLTPEALVADYRGWVDHYADDDRFNKLFLLGHSEGAHLALRAGQHSSVAAVISVSGSGRPLDDLLRFQLKDKLPESLYEKSDAILTKLRSGETVDDVPAELQTLFRPSVQPYLIGFIKRPPEQDARKLEKPLLVIQGDKDIQVTPEDAKRLAQAAPKSQFVIIEGMNHVLVTIESPDQQIASYNRPELPLAEQLVPAIVDFIRTHTKD